jgi:hypothetical protein
MADDLNFQKLSTVQSNQLPLPFTIASAATIAPTTKFTFVTGTVQVATVTPPVTGYHELTLCFTNGAPGLFLTTGNLQIAYQPVTNRPIDLCYDPSTAKYWVKAVV